MVGPTAEDLKQPKRALGDRAEAYVETPYTGAGFERIGRNWMCKRGELDLVMRRGQLVAFVEVRSVSTSWLATPLVTVNAAKQRRVAMAADAFIRQHLEGGLSLRFDVVGVVHERWGRMQAEIVENAFTPPWAF